MSEPTRLRKDDRGRRMVLIGIGLGTGIALARSVFADAPELWLAGILLSCGVLMWFGQGWSRPVAAVTLLLLALLQLFQGLLTVAGDQLAGIATLLTACVSAGLAVALGFSESVGDFVHRRLHGPGAELAWRRALQVVSRQANRARGQAQTPAKVSDTQDRKSVV